MKVTYSKTFMTGNLKGITIDGETLTFPEESLKRYKEKFVNGKLFKSIEGTTYRIKNVKFSE